MLQRKLEQTSFLAGPAKESIAAGSSLTSYSLFDGEELDELAEGTPRPSFANRANGDGGAGGDVTAYAIAGAVVALCVLLSLGGMVCRRIRNGKPPQIRNKTHGIHDKSDHSFTYPVEEGGNG